MEKKPQQPQKPGYNPNPKTQPSKPQQPFKQPLKK
jgi:hypothetical protein